MERIKSFKKKRKRKKAKKPKKKMGKVASKRVGGMISRKKGRLRRVKDYTAIFYFLLGTAFLILMILRILGQI